MNPVYIIAEAGVNHNGSLATAFKLVDAAVKAGADAVKFQSFKAHKLVTATAKKADYQHRNQNDGKSQLEMLKALELSEAEQLQLFHYCQTQAIDFLSSPFDAQSCAFLLHKLGLDTIKLGSGELTNAQLLIQISQAKVKLILSTGMSTLEDIHQALAILAYGYSHSEAPASSDDFSTAYQSTQGKALLQQYVTLMHCTTEYPCPVNEVNLAAINTLKKHFSLPCGYSDHTRGIHISVAAAALGVPVIEKHFTLDQSLPGPDHKASIEADSLAQLVHQVRDIEQALGNKHKQVTASEEKNRQIARKGLYAATKIKKGERFTQNNIILKRPVCRTTGFDYWDIIGQPAEQDYLMDEPI